jgi:hypothetical protein
VLRIFLADKNVANLKIKAKIIIRAVAGLLK